MHSHNLNKARSTLKNRIISYSWHISREKVKKSEVSQSCLTLCDMACSLPGSSVHGIFQARALEWVAISFSNPEKTLIQKDTCTPMFIATLFTIAGTWKQPKCPSTEEWIKKIWHIYTMEYYSAIKKNKIMPFAATWMD